MSHILIIGAKSEIAKAIAREYARDGYDLYLAARNSNELNEFAADIKIREQIKVECIDLDVLDFASHLNFFNSLNDKPQGVIFVAGYLGNQEKAQNEFTEAESIMDTNYKGCVSFLNIVANEFEILGDRFIVGISSVAGDRGRRSNYIYGSAKAAFTAYLSGLRNRLSKSNVNVLTVKPGFVYTKMTDGLDLPKLLTAKPERVAKDIIKYQKKGRDILYSINIWKYIMQLIKLIPERIFKKLNL